MTRVASTTWTRSARSSVTKTWTISARPAVQADGRPDCMDAVEPQPPGHAGEPDHVHGAGRPAADVDGARVPGAEPRRSARSPSTTRTSGVGGLVAGLLRRNWRKQALRSARARTARDQAEHGTARGAARPGRSGDHQHHHAREDDGADRRRRQTVKKVSAKKAKRLASPA